MRVLVELSPDMLAKVEATRDHMQRIPAQQGRRPNRATAIRFLLLGGYSEMVTQIAEDAESLPGGGDA